jgi:hypothetical protein
VATIAKMLVCTGLLGSLAQAPALFAIEGLVPPNMGRYSELSGMDSNDDGIRDDVDDFIQSSYTRTVEVAAARQFARAIQAAVNAGADQPQKSRLIALQISRAVNCVYVSFDNQGSKTQPAKVIEQVRSLTTNTKERLNSYLAFAKSQDDTAHDLPRGASCV